jgi:prepilin-type N-terminal cleavage/methylation domain-containing protein
MTNARRHVGLSLIEMLVVVAIVAVVAGLVVTLTLRMNNQAKERDLASAFALFRSALQEYHEETGEYPPQPEQNYANAAAHMQLLYERLTAEPASRQVLTHLASSAVPGNLAHSVVIRVRNPSGTVLEYRYEIGDGSPTQVRDAWGTMLDYRYGPDDDFPELISAGPDEVFGTEDDISSRTG